MGKFIVKGNMEEREHDCKEGEGQMWGWGKRERGRVRGEREKGKETEKEGMRERERERDRMREKEREESTLFPHSGPFRNGHRGLGWTWGHCASFIACL